MKFIKNSYPKCVELSYDFFDNQFEEELEENIDHGFMKDRSKRVRNRKNRIKKNRRLINIIEETHGRPGYISVNGKYVMFRKDNDMKKFVKRQASRKVRHDRNNYGKGNTYKKEFWL